MRICFLYRDLLYLMGLVEKSGGRPDVLKGFFQGEILLQVHVYVVVLDFTFLFALFIQGQLVVWVELKYWHYLFRNIEALVEVVEQSWLKKGRVLLRLLHLVDLLPQFLLPSSQLHAEDNRHQLLQFFVGTDRQPFQFSIYLGYTLCHNFLVVAGTFHWLEVEELANYYSMLDQNAVFFLQISLLSSSFLFISCL